MELKRGVIDEMDQRPWNMTRWYCCKADDGGYYAVVAASAPMRQSTRYYIITKEIFDACDPNSPNSYNAIYKGEEVIEFAEGPMGNHGDGWAVYRSGCEHLFGWYRANFRDSNPGD